MAANNRRGTQKVFTKLMVPVDVTHPGQLEKALAVAADLARHYGAGICYVAVTSSAPNTLGHTPDEAARHLDEFAAAQGETHGLDTSGHLVVSHDPAVDLDKSLLGAIQDTGADLVVADQNIFEISPDAIAETKICLTLFDGKIVYERTGV